MQTYNQINIRRSEVHCGSAIELGGSGLPYYCTPPVCVPAVPGALAVWRLSKNKTKKLSLLNPVCYYFGRPRTRQRGLDVCCAEYVT